MPDHKFTKEEIKTIKALVAFFAIFVPSALIGYFSGNRTFLFVGIPTAVLVEFLVTAWEFKLWRRDAEGHRGFR